MPTDPTHTAALAAVADATARPIIDSTTALINERGRTHGEFRDHARVAQNLKLIMVQEETWLQLSNIQREALDMIAHKIGRILAGDPEFRDHWMDISGYAHLVAERCTK